MYGLDGRVGNLESRGDEREGGKTKNVLDSAAFPLRIYTSLSGGI